MGRIDDRHRKIGDSGSGLCSVPMWVGGLPSGFCEKKAFGEQTKEYLSRFPKWNLKYNQPAYAPGLACPAHGGPDEPQKEGEV